MHTNRLRAAASAAAIVSLLLIGGTAQAQTGYGEAPPPGHQGEAHPGYGYATPDELRPRLILKGLFGFGGDVRIRGGAIDVPDPGLRTSLGVAVQSEAPLSRYFSFGGLIGALWINPEAIEGVTLDRNFLVDINIIPKFRLPFDLGVNHGEFYVGVPGGLTLSFLDRTFEDTLGDDVRIGLGFNVGVVVGAQFFLTRSFGILGEVGYQYHWIRHTADDPLAGTFDADLSFGQFVVNAGIVFGL